MFGRSKVFCHREEAFGDSNVIFTDIFKYEDIQNSFSRCKSFRKDIAEVFYDKHI